MAAVPENKTSLTSLNKARDGFYQLILDDDAPSGIFAVAAIEKPDLKLRGKIVRYNVTFEKWRYVTPLACPDCKNKWEPELPLRPGRVMRKHAEEKKWDLRLKASRYCPKCREEKQKEVRGRAIKAQGNKDNAARRVRGVQWLSGEEADRIRALASVTDYEPEYITQTQSNGTKIEVQSGWKSKPLVFRQRDATGALVEEFARKHLKLRGPLPDAYFEAAGEKLIDAVVAISGQVVDAATRIAEINERLKEKEVSKDERKDLNAEIGRLAQRQVTLLARISEPD